MNKIALVSKRQLNNFIRRSWSQLTKKTGFFPEAKAKANNTISWPRGQGHVLEDSIFGVDRNV